MAIHRKEDLKPDSKENGIIMTSLSGPERGDNMITVKEIFIEPGAEILNKYFFNGYHIISSFWS